MSIFIAGLILYVATACVTSGLLFLPAAALAESLPARRPSHQTYVWFASLLLPQVVAAAGVIYATRMHAMDPVPWAVRAGRLRHLSFWWIAEAPDAAYRIKFVALAAGVFVIVGLLRPLFSALLAWRYSRLLARSSTEVPELDIWLTPLDRPWSTCIGFLRTRVYVTKGAAELLDPNELSSVIAHEQAHADRRDNLRLLAAQAVFGPTVIMPTAHYFYRRMQAGIERAADQEAVRDSANEQTLASALVKAARKLRDFAGDPDEETLRRRMAGRYREEFVAERAEQLLEVADGEIPPAPASLIALLVPGALVVGLLIIAADLLAPTMRSLFESVLAGLTRGA